MLLRHRCFCAVDYIVNQLFTKRKRFFAAIKVAGFFLIYQDEVISAFTAGNINILAQLNKAISSEYCKSSVTPRLQAIGSKPVNSYVPGTGIATQHYVTEIFKLRILRIMHITYLR